MLECLWSQDLLVAKPGQTEQNPWIIYSKFTGDRIIIVQGIVGGAAYGLE
jgi:hypothetical protein